VHGAVQGAAGDADAVAATAAALAAAAARLPRDGNVGPVPRRGPFETYARTALGRLYGAAAQRGGGGGGGDVLIEAKEAEAEAEAAEAAEAAAAAEALEAEVEAAVALYAAHAPSSAPTLLRFGALRAVLAPVVERFLLLDRLLYVREVSGSKQQQVAAAW
jgi:hypothetical protein